MKNTLFIFTIICSLLSCNSSKKVSQTDHNSSKTNIYEGILPCADCSGIKTTLKITYSMQNNTFELISTYQGKEPGNVLNQKGNFNTERGLEKDPDGTVYILNWDLPEEKQIYYGYYSNNPEKIYLLDKDRKIILSKLDYFLMLKK